MRAVKRFLKSVGRVVFYPFLRFFDRRFADVHQHLDNVGADADPDGLIAQVARLRDEVTLLRAEVAAHAELDLELSAGLARFAEQVTTRLERAGAASEGPTHDDVWAQHPGT